MALNTGTDVIWYKANGRIPIRIGIPSGLTAPEAKAALDQFVSVVARLAALPHADEITFGDADEYDPSTPVYTEATTRKSERKSEKAE
jgi:hypothetical protein